MTIHIERNASSNLFCSLRNNNMYFLLATANLDTYVFLGTIREIFFINVIFHKKIMGNR